MPVARSSGDGDRPGRVPCGGEPELVPRRNPQRVKKLFAVGGTARYAVARPVWDRGPDARVACAITGPADKRVAAPPRRPMLGPFVCARFRFVLEATTPLRLSAVAGAALRGGFGYVFKRA